MKLLMLDYLSMETKGQPFETDKYFIHNDKYILFNTKRTTSTWYFAKILAQDDVWVISFLEKYVYDREVLEIHSFFVEPDCENGCVRLMINFIERGEIEHIKTFVYDRDLYKKVLEKREKMKSEKGEKL